MSHLGRVLDDEGDEKTLPRKANESKRVVGREPESTEGGTTYIETRRKIRLGGSKTAPSPTLNTGGDHIGAIKVDYKYKAPHQKHK